MHRHLDRFKNRKSLIALVALLGIVLITAGATYAWFSYSRNGVKENTITAGSIKFHYAEGSRTIEVDDMMPMTDSQGKAQNDYFEFTITSDTSRTVDIPYYITARRTNSSDADMDNIVKVYLTKVDNNGGETQVLLSKFNSLSGYTNSAINIPTSEKTLYNDTVLAGTQGYTQKYRLRMWIDYDAKYIVQEENQPDQYPLQDKSYALTVNVYSEGNDIGESGKTVRENADITSMSIGNTQVTTTDGVNYSAALEVASIDTVPTTIEIDTVNPNATVKVDRLTAMGETEKTNGIRKLSTQVPLELEEGTNSFKVTVISQDKSKTKIYNLTVTVEVKQPESFSTDDWKTIVNAVKSGNGAIYAPNANGKSAQAVRKVDMGSLGTHYLRVANTTPCTNGETSETACGFVIEFVDAVAMQQMGTVNSSIGGYPATNIMFDYVTNTVYNALPDYIKSAIIPTTVVSSHESHDTGTGTGRDSNSNYVTPNQQIYLLDTKEVFNDQGTEYANSASSSTRQLDYYRLNNSQADRKKQYNGSNVSWWLRSVHPSYNPNFLMVFATDGKANSAHPTTSYGVSPAFRIG